MILRMLRPILLALALACTLLAGQAGAQDQAAAPTPLIAEQQKALDALAARADAVEKTLDEAGDDDDRLLEGRLELEKVSHQALNSALVFRPRLAEINARLEQLGAAPAEGEPAEAELVGNERKALVAEKAQINVVLARAQDLSVRSARLIDQIASMRSELFRSLLTKRYQLADALSGTVIEDFGRELGKFFTSVSAWVSFVFKFKLQAALLAALLALAAAAVLLIGGRRVFGRLLDADPAVEAPSYLSRLSVAFWSTLLPTAALGVFFLSTYFFFDTYNVLRGDIGVYLGTVMVIVTMVFLVNRLATAALAPRLPNWRLIPIESSAARWLVRLATAMAVAVGLNVFLAVLNEQMRSPLSLTVARSFIAAIAVGVIIIMMGLVKPYRNEEGTWRPWPAWLRYSAFLTGGFTILTALLGYIGLAIFLSLQVVVTGTILVTAYIGFLSARAIGAEGGFEGSSTGRWLAESGKLEGGTLDQLGLAVSVALNLLIVVVSLPLILLMWGFQPGDIQSWGYKLATGLTIGSVTISFAGILSGVAVFAIGYFLTRWFQGWLDGSVMARGKVDAGVRNSIRLAVGYAGVAVAGLVGISAAGIDLSNLALVAGALSLGIGFGLQNVVSNFVSGLILLAERPFKVGDWIVAGDVSGTVKKISVRATEIETFQRQSVTLPNSNLINGAVGNWTHRNKLGRVEIKVGVAYGSDVRRAHEILLEIARGHPSVLKNPEPFVQFANFGTAALEFEVRVFLADIMNGGGVQNDLRFAILDAFGREGIEIPSTPRAVVPPPRLEPWPGDDDKTEAEFAERAKLQAEAEKNAPKGRRKPRRPDPG